MAAVTDTSGAVTGIVTMEDLLEEIVGDIRDESLNVNVARINSIYANKPAHCAGLFDLYKPRLI